MPFKETDFAHVNFISFYTVFVCISIIIDYLRVSSYIVRSAIKNKNKKDSFTSFLPILIVFLPSPEP